MQRASGVLLNISSLPSKFGIGGFGKEIDNFCDFLKKGSFSYWQILPLTVVGDGNSPYSGYSAYAINYLYVDPLCMAESGLISYDYAMSFCDNQNIYAVDYDRTKADKKALLENAYNNLSKENFNKVKDFEKNNSWVVSYAMFLTLKQINNNKEWWKWGEYSEYSKIDQRQFIQNNNNTYYYYVFEQMVCDSQWQNCRKICQDNSIKIVGDMPIYISLDSVEVWENPQNFLLDNNYIPTKVAGVPPDYFSQDGQLWGNPLYNYSYMKKTNYKWWLDRFARMFQLYDILRIDHFRAFSQYWAVDYSQTTAKVGKWYKGVGMAMLSKVLDKYPPEMFIAEDLGIIDDQVRTLLKKTKLKGMRVMQFGFEDMESIHLPHNFEPNCVGYTATHDNNTTFGWLGDLNKATRDYALQYLQFRGDDWFHGGYKSESVRAMIRGLVSSCCKLAIIPYQDLCGYGADCRMNIPGLANGNWTYRATEQSFNNCDWQYYSELNRLYGRK